MLGEVAWESVLRDSLQHSLVLYVVLHQELVDFLLDYDASGVANLEAFHAETTTDDGEDLSLLVTHIDHDPRVEAACVEGCRVTQDEVDIFAAKLFEATVADCFIQRPQAHEGLHDDHSHVKWVRL